jgi:hypothetical protein
MARVVFILSVNYSGSHLLSQLLGGHSACAAVGELKNLRKFVVQTGPDKALHDFSDNPIYDGLPLIAEADWHATLLQRIRALHPEVSVLVDNSKKTEWAERFVSNSKVIPSYIHLIRDPRALLRKWRKMYDTPAKVRRERHKLLFSLPPKLSMLTAADDRVFLYKWLEANRRITAFIASQGQAGTAITYHDLSTSTESTLTAVMHRLALPYEPGQLDYGNGRNFGTHKKDYAALSSRSEIALDVRWKDDLPRQAQEMVIQDREVRAYLASQRIGFGEHGLIGQQ